MLFILKQICIMQSTIAVFRTTHLLLTSFFTEILMHLKKAHFSSVNNQSRECVFLPIIV